MGRCGPTPPLCPVPPFLCPQGWVLLIFQLVVPKQSFFPFSSMPWRPHLWRHEVQSGLCLCRHNVRISLLPQLLLQGHVHHKLGSIQLLPLLCAHVFVHMYLCVYICVCTSMHVCVFVPTSSTPPTHAQPTPHPALHSAHAAPHPTHTPPCTTPHIWPTTRSAHCCHTFYAPHPRRTLLCIQRTQLLQPLEQLCLLGVHLASECLDLCGPRLALRRQPNHQFGLIKSISWIVIGLPTNIQISAALALRCDGSQSIILEVINIFVLSYYRNSGFQYISPKVNHNRGVGRQGVRRRQQGCGFLRVCGGSRGVRGQGVRRRQQGCGATICVGATGAWGDRVLGGSRGVGGLSRQQPVARTPSSTHPPPKRGRATQAVSSPAPPRHPPVPRAAPPASPAPWRTGLAPGSTP